MGSNGWWASLLPPVILTAMIWPWRLMGNGAEIKGEQERRGPSACVNDTDTESECLTWEDPPLPDGPMGILPCPNTPFSDGPLSGAAGVTHGPLLG